MNQDLKKHIDYYYLKMPLYPWTMLLYAVKWCILRAVKKNVGVFYGKVLDIGCGVMPYRELITEQGEVQEYIGMDMYSEEYYSTMIPPDVIWDGTKIPFEAHTFDCIIATEFFEHYHDTPAILAEINRVLKPNGLLFATVPFVWNLHHIPYDEYRFTPYSLEKHLLKASFNSVSIKPLGGFNMALAQMLGLWQFFNFRKYVREFMAVLIYPIYWILIKTDRTFDTFDTTRNSMYSGLYFLAKKSHENN